MYPNTQGYCYYFMYIYMHVIHNTVAPKEISLFMYQLDSFTLEIKVSNTIQSLYVQHTCNVLHTLNIKYCD